MNYFKVNICMRTYIINFLKGSIFPLLQMQIFFLFLATHFNIYKMTNMVQHCLKRKTTNLCTSFNLWFDVKSDVMHFNLFQGYISKFLE